MFTFLHSSHLLPIDEMLVPSIYAVRDWLEDIFKTLIPNKQFPEYTGFQRNLKYGFDVEFVRNPNSASNGFYQTVRRSLYAISAENYYEISIVFVLKREKDVDKILKSLSSFLIDVRDNVRVIVGYLEAVEPKERRGYKFIPCAEARADHRNRIATN